MNFGDVRWAFDKRLPELETAVDPAPTAAAPAFEAAIAETPSTTFYPSPTIFVTLHPRQVRFLPEWTGPTTTITPGDSGRVIARRLNARLSTLNMIGQPAYDFIIAWKTDEGTATAHSDFEYVDWATQSSNDLAAAYALPRAEV